MSRNLQLLNKVLKNKESKLYKELKKQIKEEDETQDMKALLNILDVMKKSNKDGWISSTCFRELTTVEFVNGCRRYYVKKLVYSIVDVISNLNYKEN